MIQITSSTTNKASQDYCKILWDGMSIVRWHLHLFEEFTCYYVWFKLRRIKFAIMLCLSNVWLSFSRLCIGIALVYAGYDVFPNKEWTGTERVNQHLEDIKLDQQPDYNMNNMVTKVTNVHFKQPTSQLKRNGRGSYQKLDVTFKQKMIWSIFFQVIT